MDTLELIALTLNLCLEPTDHRLLLPHLSLNALCLFALAYDIRLRGLPALALLIQCRLKALELARGLRKGALSLFSSRSRFRYARVTRGRRALELPLELSPRRLQLAPQPLTLRLSVGEGSLSPCALTLNLGLRECGPIRLLQQPGLRPLQLGASFGQGRLGELDLLLLLPAAGANPLQLLLEADDLLLRRCLHPIGLLERGAEALELLHRVSQLALGRLGALELDSQLLALLFSRRLRTLGSVVLLLQRRLHALELFASVLQCHVSFLGLTNRLERRISFDQGCVTLGRQLLAFGHERLRVGDRLWVGGVGLDELPLGDRHQTPFVKDLGPD